MASQPSSSVVASVRAAMVNNDRLAEWATDRPSTFLKAYKKPSPNPAVEEPKARAAEKASSSSSAHKSKAKDGGSSGGGLTKEQIDAFVRKEIKDKAKKLAAKMAARKGRREEGSSSKSRSSSSRSDGPSTSSATPRPGPKSSKPPQEVTRPEPAKPRHRPPAAIPPGLVEATLDFKSIIKLAERNEKKVAKSGYTRSPSPPPPLPPGPASVKRRAQEQALIYEEAKKRRLDQVAKARQSLALGSAAASASAPAKPGPLSSKPGSLGPVKSKADAKSSVGQLSEAARERLARMNGKATPAAQSPRPGPMSSKPGPASSKSTATPSPAPQQSQRPGPASSKHKPPPDRPTTSAPPAKRPGPLSSKVAAASGTRSGLGHLSDAAKERLARMNGRKQSAAAPSKSAAAAKTSSPQPSSRASTSLDKAKATTSGRLEEASEEALMAEIARRRALNARAVAPEPSYGTARKSAAGSQLSQAARRDEPDRKRDDPERKREGKDRPHWDERGRERGGEQQSRGKYAWVSSGGSGGPPGKRPPAEEEEEDSDLDGFIDDTPVEEDFGRKEVAATIREVFRGYDRRKFAGETWSRDDDRAMQASYKDVQKEERRSAILGAKEDYQEFLREKKAKKPK